MSRPAAAPAWEWLLAGLCAGLFVLLAMGVTAHQVVSVDLLLRSAIHLWSSGPLTTVARTWTILGSPSVIYLLAGVVVVLLWHAGERKAALFLIVTMTGAAIVENALKFAFRIPRPLPFFGTDPASYSFPSGHALYSTCLFGSLLVLFVKRAKGTLHKAVATGGVTIVVLGIGFSRIYLGVHYPSDVAGGYLIGVVWLCVSDISCRSFVNSNARTSGERRRHPP